MGLFKPLWMSKEYYWARKGLERIHDDATLYRGSPKRRTTESVVRH